MGLSLMYLVKGENYKKKKYLSIFFIALLISILNFGLFFLFAFIFNIPNVYCIQTTPFIFLSSGIYIFLFLIIYLVHLQKFYYIKYIFKFFECFGVNCFCLMILCQIINFIMYQSNIGNKLNELFSEEEYTKAGSIIYLLCYLLIVGLIAFILYVKKLYFKI
jgi:predicted acyltransferase